MKFSDEFEVEVAGNTYYVNVEGRKARQDTKIVNDIEFIEIHDELGELVDVDHENYEEVYQDALDREYEFEVHSANFDYYGDVG